MAKYKNKKIEINGILFDSKKEARRYQELLLLEQSGEISDLQTQVKFVLIPSQRETNYSEKLHAFVEGKVIERECAYIADFVYTENGKTIVEDVKGYRGGKAYDIFVIKRKLMLHVHGIRIREI